MAQSRRIWHRPCKAVSGIGPGVHVFPELIQWGLIASLIRALQKWRQYRAYRWSTGPRQTRSGPHQGADVTMTGD
ncbi:MAG: hypothetical protein ACK4E3_03295 [Brevundimonas sp.]|uniref:hypothetical protein n=1 Tax=Brevundimonas sp. TaxID=1871086 RepID=UPI00391A5475